MVKFANTNGESFASYPCNIKTEGSTARYVRLFNQEVQGKQMKKGEWNTAKLRFPSKDPILQKVVYTRVSPPAFNNDLIEEAKPTEN